MTTTRTIVRSGMLAAGVAASLVLAVPAEAASTYEASLDVTLRVVTTQAGVTITGDTDVVLLDTSAAGDIGTFASAALDLDPADPTVLGAGDALTMTTNLFSGFQGETVNGPSLNVATSDVQGEGEVTVANNSGNNAKIVFELTYALSGTAAIDDAAFDAAFLNLMLAISTPSAPLVAETITVDLPAGGLSGGGAVGNTFVFTLALDAGDVDTIFLSTSLSGIATTQAMSPVPVPAALPLFAAGLAGLGLTASRRNRR